MSGVEPLGSLDIYHADGISVITLANSANGNPLNTDLLKELDSALKQSLERIDTRVIVLRSNGTPFCIGMDLGALSKGMQGPEASSVLKFSIEAYSTILTRMYDGKKPILCVVDGDVRAGGVGLVCASDMVFATRRAQFTLSEVLFGLIPANVLPYLLGLRVSPQKARYIILSSKTITAEEALWYGIVDEVFDKDAIEKRLRACIKQLLRSSPDALAQVKQFTAENLWNPIAEFRAHAIDELIAIINSGKALSAIRAYQDGSTPDWFARFKPDQPLFLQEDS